LTEVEVHGTDLDLGLDDWSDVFVTQALAVRLEWLMTRRSNHRDVDTGIDGSWLLVVRDGDATLVTARGQQVTVEVVERSRAADAVIEGSGRDLLALLLGRPPRHGLEIRGDQQWGRAFERAFPGP
jgi:predicted lipid carrier protein YhbT